MKEKNFLLLDEKTADEFHALALKTPDYPQDKEEMSILKKQLIDLCGVTELEALNILIGRNVKDYIVKYAGKASGKVIEAKEYEGEVHVVYNISDEEKELFEWK